MRSNSASREPGRGAALPCRSFRRGIIQTVGLSGKHRHRRGGGGRRDACLRPPVGRILHSENWNSSVYPMSIWFDDAKDRNPRPFEPIEKGSIRDGITRTSSPAIAPASPTTRGTAARGRRAARRAARRRGVERRVRARPRRRATPRSPPPSRAAWRSSRSPRRLGSPQAATPSFPAQPPAGSSGWPVASTIRRLSLTAPGLSAWIARSSEGGICVLLYDGQPVHGVAALDIGCSTPEGLTRGAEVEVSEIPGLPGETIAAGVVPDGVSSVSQTMADGSTARSTVSGNAWARISAVPAAPGEQPNRDDRRMRMRKRTVGTLVAVLACFGAFARERGGRGRIRPSRERRERRELLRALRGAVRRPKRSEQGRRSAVRASAASPGWSARPNRAVKR